MKVEKAIENYKQRLIRKAKRAGIWENFGQIEVRLIEHIYGDHQYKDDGVWDKVTAFDNWCQTYTGE